MYIYIINISILGKVFVFVVSSFYSIIKNSHVYIQSYKYQIKIAMHLDSQQKDWSSIQMIDLDNGSFMKWGVLCAQQRV